MARNILKIVITIIGYCALLLLLATLEWHFNLPDQYKLRYIRSGSMFDLYREYLGFIIILYSGFVYAIAINVVLDIALKKNKTALSYDFFPRFDRLFCWVRNGMSLITLCIGIPFASAYWLIASYLIYFVEIKSHREVYPPPRIILVTLTFIGVFWLADALSRPRKETLIAACMYNLGILMFIVLYGFFILRG